MASTCTSASDFLLLFAPTSLFRALLQTMTPQIPADAERRIGLDSVRIWQCTRASPLSAGLELQRTNVDQKLERIKNERKEKAHAFKWTKEATWIHIPANDMELCKDVLRRICSEGQSEELVQPEYWSDQLHEPVYDDEKEIERNEDEIVSDWTEELVKAPFMDVKTWKRNFGLRHGNWHLRKGKQHEKEGDADSKNKLVENLIIYMPYLHWAERHEHGRTTTVRHRNWVRKREQPSVHPRRSLDEAALHQLTYSSLMERNEDQVVSRYQQAKQEMEEERRSNDRGAWHHGKLKYTNDTTIMVVDQLWLWLLDDDTVVTSFPDSPGDRPPGGCDRPSWCKHLHLECLARGWFNSPGRRHNAWRLANCIVDRSYSVFRHPHITNPDLRYMEIFRKSIEAERVKSSDLFIALQGRKQDTRVLQEYAIDDDYKEEQERRMRRRKSRKQHTDLYDIQEDIASVVRIRDIEEELRIILHIVQLQKTVLSTFAHYAQAHFLQEVESQIEDLNALCAQAGNIHEKLFQTLELKQTLLSVRQNNIVLIFTVVTIIFLPLGFISSIFGMNASELTDGSPVKLKRIFAYMFPISFVISIIAFALTYVRIDMIWRRSYTSLLPAKSWVKRGSRRQSSSQNSSGKETQPV
ncbi:cora-like Mg2+ transporter protein-domain-containing protein [Phaeosphaeriaceae sp. PMI808]|nr:cora-like Mg2+ transporter protein-domain-containing protein [Phaeosphaeriaceae sp. PMI808]